MEEHANWLGIGLRLDQVKVYQFKSNMFRIMDFAQLLDQDLDGFGRGMYSCAYKQTSQGRPSTFSSRNILRFAFAFGATRR